MTLDRWTIKRLIRALELATLVSYERGTSIELDATARAHYTRDHYHYKKLAEGLNRVLADWSRKHANQLPEI